jgi:hypothetical protein
VKLQRLLFIGSSIVCLVASAEPAEAAVAVQCATEGARCYLSEPVPCCNPLTLCTFQYYDNYLGPIYNCQAVD